MLTGQARGQRTEGFHLDRVFLGLRPPPSRTSGPRVWGLMAAEPSHLFFPACGMSSLPPRVALWPPSNPFRGWSCCSRASCQSRSKAEAFSAPLSVPSFFWGAVPGRREADAKTSAKGVAFVMRVIVGPERLEAETTRGKIQP